MAHSISLRPAAEHECEHYLKGIRLSAAGKRHRRDPQQTGLDPKYLQLEITETIAMGDPEKAQLQCSPNSSRWEFVTRK